MAVFILNYKSGEPIYQQIYNEIVKEISLGILISEAKLPTVREFASELGINPNTVSKAYQLLEQNGYIYSVVGKGSFVADSSVKLAGLKESTINKIKKEIGEAYSLGIEYDALLKIIDTVYNGGEKDNA